MSVINQAKSEHDSPFLALSTVVDIDSKRMIKRLCQHFSHKINAEWNESYGYIEFAMGFCEMNGDNRRLNLCCGALSETELIEIVNCIDNHFLRFVKQSVCSLEWSTMDYSR